MTALRATRGSLPHTHLPQLNSTTGVELTPRNTRRANSIFIQIARFRFALRRDPSVAQHHLFSPYTHPSTSSIPSSGPFRAPLTKVMRFPPPNPFSFSGITTRLFFRPRFLASDATSCPASSSQHPYLVPRNSRGTLPVYSDVRNGGTRYLISIRNVEGNIKVCDPTPHDRSPLIRVTKGSS